MSMVRGSSLGICAMARETHYPERGVTLVRPMLDITKDAIKEYAIHGKIPWIDDEDNTNLSFQRNYWRHVIIPNIKKCGNIYKTIPRSIATPERISVSGTLFG
jgi:tRNA(Ile)-lysidine synthase